MRTLFYNGQIYCGENNIRQAFLVEEGRILQVGEDEALLSLSCDRQVNLQGAFVCPGFNDSHMHLLNLGNTMAMCHLAEAGSLADLQQRLSSFLEQKNQQPGQWLLGRGWNQDHFSPASGMPTRDDLDKVSRLHPICIVRCCGHALCVNSRALELLGIGEHTPLPARWHHRERRKRPAERYFPGRGHAPGAGEAARAHCFRYEKYAACRHGKAEQPGRHVLPDGRLAGL